MDSQRHRSQTIKNWLLLNSSKVYVSCSRLLMCSLSHTTQRPMGRWNDTTRPWQSWCINIWLIVRRTEMHTLQNLFNTTTAKYAVLQTLGHSIRYSIGGYQTLHWNKQCLLENPYPRRKTSRIRNYTTALIGSYSSLLQQIQERYKRDFDHRNRKGCERKGLVPICLMMYWKVLTRHRR